MARRGGMNDFIFYGAVAGASWIVYRMAAHGSLGNDAQMAAEKLQGLLTGGTGLAIGGTPTGTGGTKTSYQGRVFPQDNGDGTFSVVQENPAGTYRVLYGPTSKSAMEAWYTQNIGTYRG